MQLVKPSDCIPRATATVELLSRVYRPWLFRVTVTGEYPHEARCHYDIAAVDDNAAALKGLRLFEEEMSKPLAIVRAT
jgi:hypothetical protein